MTDQGPRDFTPSREMPSYTPTLGEPAPYAYPTSPSSTFSPGRTRPGGYQRRKPSRMPATCALILAVLPIPIICHLAALGLGIRVLTQSRDVETRGKEYGSGRAVAAIVIASIWLLATGVLLAMHHFGQPQRNTAGAVTRPGAVSVNDLAVGDCLPGPVSTSTVTYQVSLVPCAQAHAGEVYANYDLADGPYPGDAVVARGAQRGCTGQRYRDFVGTSYARSRLDVTYMVPQARTWSTERGVTCVIIGPVASTGTLKGSKN